MFVFSVVCQNKVAPQLKRARPLSMRTEIPKGGVVVRGGANACLHWVTTRLGDDASGTAITGPRPVIRYLAEATTEMLTCLPFTEYENVPAF